MKMKSSLQASGPRSGKIVLGCLFLAGLLGGCATSPGDKASTAISRNDSRALEAALSSGADSDAALREAIQEEKPQLVRALLTKGVNPNAEAIGYDLLKPAIASRREGSERWEVEAELPETLRSGEEVAMPQLRRARKEGTTVWIEELPPQLRNTSLASVSSGSGVFYTWQVKEVPGRQPLHEAIKVGNPEIVSELLKAGARPDIRVATQSCGWLGRMKRGVYGIGVKEDAAGRDMLGGGSMSARNAWGWIDIVNGNVFCSWPPVAARFEDAVTMAQRLRRESSDPAKQSRYDEILKLMGGTGGASEVTAPSVAKPAGGVAPARPGLESDSADSDLTEPDYQTTAVCLFRPGQITSQRVISSRPPIVIDGVNFEALGMGEVVRVPVSPGRHSIVFEAGDDLTGTFVLEAVSNKCHYISVKVSGGKYVAKEIPPEEGQRKTASLPFTKTRYLTPQEAALLLKGRSADSSFVTFENGGKRILYRRDSNGFWCRIERPEVEPSVLTIERRN